VRGFCRNSPRNIGQHLKTGTQILKKSNNDGRQYLKKAIDTLKDSDIDVTAAASGSH
jgi:hypothetical protein